MSLLPRRLVCTALFTALFSLALGLTGPGAAAHVLPFDKSWKEQGFLRLWSNDYLLQGRDLQVVSDGTVSLLYRAVPRSLWQADRASWRWQVAQGVTATDLTVKGGDDRNLAIYFVFVDRASAEKLSRRSARRLLRNRNTRALAYVWGGAYPPGTILDSPYGNGVLKTVIARPASTGAFLEEVDLAADFARAFGGVSGVLVGIGITADSDDTDGRIVARISDLGVEVPGE